MFVDKVFPPVVPVEALLFCGNRLFSGGMDEQLHEHNIQTGRLVVIYYYLSLSNKFELIIT